MDELKKRRDTLVFAVCAVAWMSSVVDKPYQSILLRRAKLTGYTTEASLRFSAADVVTVGHFW